jgi:amidase
MDDFSKLDAVGQAELVRTGQVSPSELVEAAIARIESIGGRLNAVIHPLFEHARERARGTLPDGPFRGVPFLLKDLDATMAGVPFHAGMEFLKRRDYRPDVDAYYTRQIHEAGFVVVGKTNTPELGLTVTTEPRAFGPSRNPWNTDHSTGGSSGGSAAAVAARLVPAAHASDGGGSIRIPASECGLVGLKPSRGRVSLGPQYGEYWSGLVTNHVVSRSVRDTACILDCVDGAMPGDPYQARAKARPWAEELSAKPVPMRIGTLMTRPGSAGGELHADCRQAVAETAELLAGLGHRVETAHPSALDRTDEQAGAFMGLVGSWVDSALREWSIATGEEIGPDDVEPGTWALAQAGRAESAGRLVDHLKWAGRFTREVDAWWEEGFDVLVTPTLATPPPPLGWLADDSVDPLEGIERIMSMIAYTPAFNITGQPAISLPLYWTADGLPVGVQFVARLGREDVLLRLAGELERARPWCDRQPPVSA